MSIILSLLAKSLKGYLEVMNFNKNYEKELLDGFSFFKRTKILIGITLNLSKAELFLAPSIQLPCIYHTRYSSLHIQQCLVEWRHEHNYKRQQVRLSSL